MRARPLARPSEPSSRNEPRTSKRVCIKAYPYPYKRAGAGFKSSPRSFITAVTSTGYEILPKNALVRQYRKMFQLEDVELEFEDAALHEIARMALARKTGARGLRSICEDVLQQTMFDLPSEEGVSKVIVTEASVKGEEQPQRIYG